ncbi:hypothetical protein [Roseospira visakhapatnamensis]|uniref:Uncharacterized protein n=1 Tax=Roseospira visakhapatnamensis TaxID=390880 RepID=A0A7W6RAE6_9PROT|nr:hypothetical protein [Roseospira visakhapatnamensis]MBB4264925.1 hypothetical protein [Roseospira visakhapatnamensis]
MTTAPLDRRALCRGLVSRAVRAVTQGPAETLADLSGDPGPEPGSADRPAEDRSAASRDRPSAAPVPDFFASFDQCHTLIAEMRPFLADAIRDLGIDPHGKTDVDLAREIMAHQRPSPAAPRTSVSDTPGVPLPESPAKTSRGGNT